MSDVAGVTVDANRACAIRAPRDVVGAPRDAVGAPRTDETPARSDIGAAHDTRCCGADAAPTPSPAPSPERQRAARESTRRIDDAIARRVQSGAPASTTGASTPTTTAATTTAPAGANERAERRFSDAEIRAYAALLGGEAAMKTSPVPEGLFPPVKGDVFTGFRQGAAGNCVSVAAIKAAMTAFGPDRVFKSIAKSGDGGLDVRMRDDKQVHLSNAELNDAAAGSRFTGSDRGLLRRAIVMYAAMAKRAQIEGNDGVRNLSFRNAMGTLNNGEQLREGAHWLGLDRSVRAVGPRDVNRYAAVINANNSHAVFSTHGRQDWYGSAQQRGFLGSAFAIIGDQPIKPA